MKAAVWRGHKDVVVMDAEEPQVTPGTVKIKVEWAGICGTDRHEYAGPVFLPVNKPHRLTGRRTPLILGHEYTGEIVEIAAAMHEALRQAHPEAEVVLDQSR